MHAENRTRRSTELNWRGVPLHHPGLTLKGMISGAHLYPCHITGPRSQVAIRSLSPLDPVVVLSTDGPPLRGVVIPWAAVALAHRELSCRTFESVASTVSCLPTASYQSLSRRTGLRIVPIVEEVDHTSKVHLVPDLCRLHTYEARLYGFRL